MAYKKGCLMTCQKEISLAAKKFVGRNISNYQNLRDVFLNQPLIFEARISCKARYRQKV